MTKSIVFAAGCFWGVEELIRALPGVISTEVGYTGGDLVDPTYNQVKTGRTGHAEAVEITYDSTKTNLTELFDLFFKLHDPTTLNRQGNDIGTQYRSAIFVRTDQEKTEAAAAIERAKASKRWARPITTTIEPLIKFYPAEDYHQDYLQKHPDGYTCHYWRD